MEQVIVKPRRISTLLLILKAQVEHTDSLCGLCKEVQYLTLKDLYSVEEGILVNTYLEDNRPKEAKGHYWYKAGALEPRVHWLNIHINKQLAIEMKAFKPRKVDSVGATLLSISIALSLALNLFTYHTNWIISLVLIFIAIFILWEIGRTLWYHYE